MRALILASLLVLLGCGSAAPQRTLYLLRAPVVDADLRLEAPLAIGLGAVNVAAYIDRPGLVVETGSHEVRPARLHNWAEPLPDGVRARLVADLGHALGYPLAGAITPRVDWAYAVDVTIDQLHGTMAGEALLSAHFRVTPAGLPATEFAFSRTRPLPREGYAGLVDAEVALIGELAGAIADALGQLGAP